MYHDSRARRRPGLRGGPAVAWVMLAVTVVFLLLIALDVFPALRGPGEWRWTYALPGDPARLLIAGLALLAYVLLVSLWAKRERDGEVAETRTWPYLLVVALAVPAIQASLLALGHHDILRPLFYRAVSVGGSGVFSVGSTIADPAEFLRTYPELMPTFPVHPQRYPPGLPLLFHLAGAVAEAFPALSDAVGFRLRLYQCHDLALMRLSNATLSSAALQMALPVLSGLTVFPLYWLARDLYGRSVGTWVVALFPLIPSFALWSGRWEQFLPFLATLSWYLLYLGLRRARPSAIAGAGAVLSLASFLNLSLLALLAPMGLFAVLHLVGRPLAARRARFVAFALAAFLVGLASVWAIVELGFGTGLADVWRVAMSYHLGLGRGYLTWLGYHLYDFLLFLGIPLAVLFLYACWRALRGVCGRASNRSWPDHDVGQADRSGAGAASGGVEALVIGFAMGLLILDLSGTSRGEVARVWLFLTPFAALAAVRGLQWARLGQRGFVLVAALMAAQLLVFNAFLRVVTTGVTDPPARTRSFDLDRALSAVSHPLGATFAIDESDAIALLGYDATAEALEPGDRLELTLYWQSLRQVETAFTVFTHLVGSGGAVVGQLDGMPQAGAAPTTCWVPGEVLVDSYRIEISPEAAPGAYRLTVGFYDLATGERLPAAGESATADREVVLATIEVAGR